MLSHAAGDAHGGLALSIRDAMPVEADGEGPLGSLPALAFFRLASGVMRDNRDVCTDLGVRRSTSSVGNRVQRLLLTGKRGRLQLPPG